jgi:hypothetical protein
MNQGTGPKAASVLAHHEEAAKRVRTNAGCRSSKHSEKSVLALMDERNREAGTLATLMAETRQRGRRVLTNRDRATPIAAAKDGGERPTHFHLTRKLGIRLNKNRVADRKQGGG